MRRFDISIDISAPPERVWRIMSDIDRWQEWTPSITSVRRLNDAPFAVGSRVLVRQPKLPPAIWKITLIEPGRSFTWVSAAPGLRVVARHSVDAAADGTRARLSIEFHGIFGGVFGRLTKAINERYLGFEAQGLKARSETHS